MRTEYNQHIMDAELEELNTCTYITAIRVIEKTSEG